MRMFLFLIFIVMFVFSSNAEAHHKHHYNHHTYTRQIEQSSFFDWFKQPQEKSARPANVFHTRALSYAHNAQIVSHPSGCPRSAFCGCGAAVRVFGKPIRTLFLAANWFKFPRTSPTPGAVAVRNHHVMVLEAKGEHGGWIVYDANSGHGRTQIHERSLAGYVVVNPHG
jgi:hypothetical protein